ncbi:DUF1186 domain-containing protein [Methylobacterium sp. A54F]
MSDADLIAILRQAEHLPRAALERAVADPSTIAEATLAVLDTAADDPDAVSDADANLLFWGLHVLAAARDTRALPPVLRLLRQDPEALDGILGDAITATLHRVVAALYDGEVEPLFAVLLDSSADDEARNAVFAALTHLTHEGRIPREAVAALLVRFDDGRKAVEGGSAWIGWEETIALLGLKDLAPRAEAARRDGRLTGEFSDPAWFRETLQRAVRKPADPRDREARGLGTLDDPIADLAWTAEGAGEPVRNPFKDVGRNDPCPCGSGLKFKKCCLDRAPIP